MPAHTHPRQARGVPENLTNTACLEPAAVRDAIAGVRRRAHTTIDTATGSIGTIKAAAIGNAVTRIRSRTDRSTGSQRRTSSRHNQHHHGNQHKQRLSHTVPLLPIFVTGVNPDTHTIIQVRTGHCRSIPEALDFTPGPHVIPPHSSSFQHRLSRRNAAGPTFDRR